MKTIDWGETAATTVLFMLLGPLIPGIFIGILFLPLALFVIMGAYGIGWLTAGVTGLLFSVWMQKFNTSSGGLVVLVGGLLGFSVQLTRELIPHFYLCHEHLKCLTNIGGSFLVSPIIAFFSGVICASYYLNSIKGQSFF